ncbi:ABC transporter permease [Brevibacterium metallidurans]|uniref:Molybdate transport system permease protein n=1 Tax=Brevibacterium metallidurans TaxID=1482676 RepID=A0ABP3C537_9MICO
MPGPLRRPTGAPAWLWIPAALGAAFLLVPIIGILLRIDPGRLGEVITAPESLLAMGLSLLTATIAALISLIIGFPLGYLLATTRFRGQRLVRTLILLPLVLPPVVSGLALLYTWGRSAYLGRLLTEAGLGLAYTTAAVVVAQIFVSLPFMVMSIETAVAARGQRWELAAAELGATPTRVFFTVTVPMLVPGIMTGTVLCFARSLGEFGATLTFAGSLSGVTRTMPLQIYLVRESDPQSAIALSLLLIVVALLIIVLAYRSPHAPRLRAVRGSAEAVDGSVAPAAGDTDDGDAADGFGPTRVLDRVHDRGANASAIGRNATDTISLQATESARGIALDLDIPVGTTTAVIGRNGAGKSSMFEILTGALPAESGTLRIGDRTVFDVAAGLWPPVHARGIVHLSQHPLLFPHLSVLDNVAFGLRARGLPRESARAQAAAMLDRLGVGECAHRRPDAVSGGQAARIALARALVVDPTLLLLDEPLAALDVDVRVGTRRVLAEVLADRSAILITHDPADVTALADTLVLIDAGSAVLTAPVAEIPPAEADGAEDFLRSFCETDAHGILCSRSQQG